jgi:Aspartyl protease
MMLLIRGLFVLSAFQLLALLEPPETTSPETDDVEEEVWVQPNLIRIPFRLVGGLIVVRGQADTLQGNFIFDTGASELLLNQRLFSSGGATTAVSAGVTGSVTVKGQKRLDSLIVDNLEGRNIRADLIDLGHIERVKNMPIVGILGYKVFKDFEVLFDYKSRLILLVRLNKEGQPFQKIPEWEYMPTHTFPLEVKGHVAMLTLNFGKKKKTFGLDSGAEQNLLSKIIGKNFLETNFSIGKRVKLRGTGNESAEVLTGTLNNAQLDTLKIDPMATILGDMSSINTIYGTQLTGILGYEFLVQRPVSINYKRRRLTFYREVFNSP